MNEPSPNDARPQDGPALLAERYGRELQNYLARRLWSREDARDLAQEVYLRLLRLGKTDIASHSPSYFFGVAENVLRDFKLRARQQLVTFDSELVGTLGERAPHSLPDAIGEQLSLRRELKSALARLPPNCRAVLLLHKRDGMSYAEVAQTLGLSVHTVQKYVARALALLRAQRWESRMSQNGESP